MKKFSLILIMLFFAAFTLMAQQPFMGGPMENVYPNEMDMFDNPALINEIKLTDQQYEKIDAIETKTKKSMIQTGADLLQKRLELKEEMSKEKLDDARIEKLINDIAKLQNDMFKNRMNAQVESIKVLTPEQRKELKRIMARHRPGKWMKHHMKDHKDDKEKGKDKETD